MLEVALATASPHSPLLPMLTPEAPASLGTLPDALLHTLCQHVDDVGCLSLRAADHTLRAALSGPDADLGVWKPRVEALLRRADARTFHMNAAITSVPAAKDSATHEQRFAFLRRHAALVGEYLWPLPVHGGVVRVKVLGADTFVAVLTMRPRARLGERYVTVPLFRITRDEGSSGSKLTLSEQLGDARAYAVERTDEKLRLRCRKPSLLQSPLAFMRSLAQPSVACDALPTEPVATPGLAALNLEPYFYGDYGPHGTELLHVNWGPLPLQRHSLPLLPDEVTHGLRGLKVCGDPNVPAGRCSFAAWGDFLSAGEAMALQPRAGACSCMYACECFRPDELGSADGTRPPTIEVVGAMVGTAKTAMTGYRAPEDNPGRLVFFRKRRPPGPESQPDAAGVYKPLWQMPGEISAVGGLPPDDDTLHILLVWDGARFKTSTRLSPIRLFREGLSTEAGPSGAPAPSVVDGLAVQEDAAVPDVEGAAEE